MKLEHKDIPGNPGVIKNNIHTSVTESDEPLADNVKNFGNMFQRPRFETMHQVLLPEIFKVGC